MIIASHHALLGTREGIPQFVGKSSLDFGCMGGEFFIALGKVGYPVSGGLGELFFP